MQFNLITFLTLLVLVLNFTKFWFLSKGNLWVAYRLDVAIYTIFLFFETVVALRDPSQYSLLLMNIMNFWAIIASIKGILRLKRQQRK